MLGQSFYHETIRNVVVSFGTIFNSIQLVRKDNDGAIQQTMKVPLAYGPRQKFLVRLNEDADLSKTAAVTLPRIGFEISGLTYDSARKLNRVQKFKKVKGSRSDQLDTQYMPVPYNIDFDLYILGWVLGSEFDRLNPSNSDVCYRTFFASTFIIFGGWL